MEGEDTKPYKPPDLYCHSEIDLKTVRNANCTGMTVTTNDRLLFCDCSKSRVLIFDRNNRFLFEIDTKFQPWDITALKGTEKAVVSSYNGNVMEFIDLENKKRLKWVTLEGSAIGGIESDKDYLYVGGTGKIHTMDHQGNSVILEDHGNTAANIKAKSKGTIWYICLLKNGTFCYSDFYNVFCVKIDGTPLFSYKSPELQNPQKITSDNHGNIYIVGYLSNNIHRLSPEGVFIDIVLKQGDGLDKPRALYFNNRHTKMYLSNKDGRVILVLNAK